LHSQIEQQPETRAAAWHGWLGVDNTPLSEDRAMLNWAVLFLIIALIAGGLGLSGAVAGTALNIAWILFVLFIILFLVGMVTGRRPPVA
jgi:uncharacterized membrane protein YtjA (UPF0391 family)